MIDDEERCFRAMQSRDSRFDGWFVVAVVTTRIYCRPSCPAITPRRANVRFFATAAGAQQHGFRACKRCRPDASPGSPEWNRRSDTVARAMRLIADGVVDREGVGGLAHRLGYSLRQLNRLITAELGAGPLAIARAQRAETARVLVESSDLALTDVAFAAGFGSVRQFNETVRAVFAASPRELRARRACRTAGATTPVQRGWLSLRLPARPPFAAEQLFDFLSRRAIAGIESIEDGWYARSLTLPHGVGVVRMRAEGDDAIRALVRVTQWRDITAAVQRCRRLLDLDADPQAVDDVLGRDPLLRPLVERVPGRRAAGAVDGVEIAVRAILGQQVSVAGARTIAARLVRDVGTPLAMPEGSVTHAFPAVEAIAVIDRASLPIPAVRASTLRALCAAVADGSVVLDPGADRQDTTEKLLRLPGVGPWTASYIAMRALGDPDVFLSTDLGVRRALAGVGRHPADATRWSPWRSYAVHHLWASLTPPAKEQSCRQAKR